jgi:hypothetical protein
MEIKEIVEKINNKEATRKDLAAQLGISDTTITREIGRAGYVWNNSERQYIFKPENQEVQESTEIQPKVKIGTQKVKKEKSDTNKNAQFDEEETRILRQLIKERQHNYKLFEEYRVYEELSKVPLDAEMVRNAYNMSKGTTERLKKYANERRLPLQDLVELAVIELLDKYGAK